MFIIQKLQGYALTALAVLLVLVGAYAMGGRASRKAADKKQLLADSLRAAAGAKGVHDAQLKVDALPPGGAADQLRAGWMRDADADSKGTGGDTT